MGKFVCRYEDDYSSTCFSLESAFSVRQGNPQGWIDSFRVLTVDELIRLLSGMNFKASERLRHEQTESDLALLLANTDADFSLFLSLLDRIRPENSENRFMMLFRSLHLLSSFFTRTLFNGHNIQKTHRQET